MASNEVSFEQATAFNNQLMALKKMGIEFDVGFRRDEDLPTKLRQIESEIVLRSGRGESTCHSLDEALRSADVPKKYRSALLIWSTCDNPTVVLEAISQPARERNELRTELGRHLLYPVFVMVLTLVGFFVFWGVSSCVNMQVLLLAIALLHFSRFSAHNLSLNRLILQLTGFAVCVVVHN